MLTTRNSRVNYASFTDTVILILRVVHACIVCELLKKEGVVNYRFL